MERELIAVLLLAAVIVSALRFRRRTAKGPERVDPADFGGARWIAFTSPYCLPCRHWRETLAAHGVDAAYVDVATEPELAQRYGVTATPLVLRIDADGRVQRTWFGEPPARLTLAA